MAGVGRRREMSLRSMGPPSWWAVAILAAECGADGGILVPGPASDVLEDLRGGSLRPPVRHSVQPPAVGHVERHVAGPVLAGRRDRDLVFRELAAERGRLGQRERHLTPAA